MGKKRSAASSAPTSFKKIKETVSELFEASKTSGTREMTGLVKKGEKDITNVHTAALEHESSVTRAAADAQSQYNEQHGRTETIKQRAEALENAIKADARKRNESRTRVVHAEQQKLTTNLKGAA